jgi:hypothetical protein
VWRFKAQGLRASWYPSLALVAFSAVSLTGNALHAHPVETGGLLLTRWAAAAFSTVPPLALLAASHMLVMIVTHRSGNAKPPTDRQAVGERAADRSAVPATPSGQASAARVGADRPVSPGASGAALDPVLVSAQHGGRSPMSEPPGARPSPVTAAEPSAARGDRSAVTDGDGDLVRWVSARVAAGQAVSGPQAVVAGVVASESTARRRLRQLRLDRPELFAPGAAHGGPVGADAGHTVTGPVLALVGVAR